MRRLKSNKCLLPLVLLWLGVAGLPGCATYKPADVSINLQHPVAQTAVNGALCVSVEEYANEEKCLRAFDSNLPKGGVLPLLISVRNNGSEPYEVGAGDIKITGGLVLPRLTSAQAAEAGKRSAVGPALGWSLIVPIISIPVAAVASVAHTQQVNRKIVEDFHKKSFPDGLVMPNREQSGFLFFALEKGHHDLNGLQLELTARNSTTKEPVRVSVPLPKASFEAKDSPLKNGQGQPQPE